MCHLNYIIYSKNKKKAIVCHIGLILYKHEYQVDFILYNENVKEKYTQS